jgi:hypothetical protein
VPTAVAIAANSSSSVEPDPAWLRADTTAEVAYPDAATVARPAMRVATVDPDAAVAEIEKAGFSPDMRPGTPEVALRSVTRHPKGQTRPEYADRLAWVVTYRGSAPDVHGPMTMTQERREQLNASLYCVMVFLVDADNGDLFDAQQYCKS